MWNAQNIDKQYNSIRIHLYQFIRQFHTDQYMIESISIHT